MKLYCITGGSEIFEVWSNDPIMCRFSDPKADTLDRHPEILKKLPKNMSGDGDWFNDGLFLSEDAAWEAYFNSSYINRKKFEERTGKKLTKENYLKENGDSARKCLCVEIPEVRDVELEHVENESCANCAFDFYTEDDGYEWHKCPFNSKACGRPDQKCKHWLKCGSCKACK